MKQFNLNKDEKILSFQKGYKRKIVIQSIVAIAAAAFAIVLISDISSKVGQISVAISEAIIITLSITLFYLNLNDVLKTVTTRVILTDQRLVYMQSGIGAKNIEIPVNQIKDLYYQMDSIFDESSGKITVIKKNDFYEDLTFYEELPNVENAFDIKEKFTRHIVNKALNNK